MWQHQGVPHVLLTSARGPPNADVIMAVDDVSIDPVNIDQVNADVIEGHDDVSIWRTPC